MSAIPPNPTGEQMGEWRDIATAPKDGTVILAWCDAMDWPEAVMWIDYTPDDDQDEPGFWAYAEDMLNDATGGANPVHWQPLPSHPTSPSQQGEQT